MLGHMPMFVRSSRNVTVDTLISGSLSVTLFLPAVPKKTTLIIFLSAACSLRLFIRAKCLAACSVAILNNSFTDKESFVLTASLKKSHYFSHSVLGAVSAEYQYTGNPYTTDAFPDFATSPLSAESRSAML